MTWRPTSLQQAAQHALEPIARLQAEAGDLSARFGLAFEEGHDDLDDFAVAAITMTGDGAEPLTVGFFRYRHAPEPGCEVHAPRDADPAATLRRLIAAMRFEPTEVVEWWDGQRWRQEAGPSPTTASNG